MLLLLRGGVQQVADALGVGVDFGGALYEIARIAFHEDGVFVEIGVFVSCDQSGLERGVVLACGVQYETNSHDEF